MFRGARCATPTCFEGPEGEDPLGGDLGAVVLHHGEAQEGHVLEVDLEQEVLAPHGVERVAVDGLGAAVAAVHRHAQNVHLHAGAARAAAGAHVLARNDLQRGPPASQSRAVQQQLNSYC